jgi:hypothetical protein
LGQNEIGKLLVICHSKLPAAMGHEIDGGGYGATPWDSWAESGNHAGMMAH